jgi:putative membrane protein
MESVMESFKKVVRGALAASAMMCLISFGAAAQDQAAPSASSDQSAATAKHTKSKKAAASSDSNSSASAKLSAADKKFVMDAAKGGMMEVELGKIAAEKGNSSDVKQFGQRMVDDHSKANDQLKTLAEQKGVTLPTDLDAKDKAMKDKMSGLSGDQFDKMYMQHMVMDHKKDVAEFKKESNSAKDSDLKNWAAQTLPTLEDHLKNAQQVAGTTKGAAASSKSSTKTSAKASKKSSSAMSEQPPVTPKQ